MCVNSIGEMYSISWRGVLVTMHGRSRMAIDPRIPTMPGRSTRLFADRADIARTKREAPWGVGRVAWRVCCILLREPILRRIFLHMDDSVNYLVFFLAWPLPETALYKWSVKNQPGGWVAWKKSESTLLCTLVALSGVCLIFVFVFFCACVLRT